MGTKGRKLNMCVMTAIISMLRGGKEHGSTAPLGLSLRTSLYNPVYTFFYLVVMRRAPVWLCCTDESRATDGPGNQAAGLHILGLQLRARLGERGGPCGGGPDRPACGLPERHWLQRKCSTHLFKTMAFKIEDHLLYFNSRNSHVGYSYLQLISNRPPFVICIMQGLRNEFVAMPMCVCLQNARKVVALLLSHRSSTHLLWSAHSPLSLAIASGNDLVTTQTHTLFLWGYMY